MKNYITLFLLGATLAGAQTPTKPIPTEVAPVLSTTELYALKEVENEINVVLEAAKSVNAEIQKNHPGYTFDFNSRQLVKTQPIVPTSAPPVKPAPVTATPKQTPKK